MEEKNIVSEENKTENKKTAAPVLIKSITAVICAAAVAFGSTSIATKVCDSRTAVASGTSGGAGNQSSSAVSDDSFFAEAEAAYSETGSDSTDNGSSEAGVSDFSGGSDSESSGSGSSSGSSSNSKNNGSSSKSAKEITLTSGLQSANISEILKYYKLVAAKNEKNPYTVKMTMASLNGGSGAVGSLITAFKPIAQKALAKNSNVSNDIPGIPANIKESDWKQARAVNDGTYTTLYIQVKEQTDNAYGKMDEGTVGRSITVLDGVQRAIDDLPGVSADFANGKFSLVYDNAYIKVKIKNSTGEFVKGSCTWHYAVNVNMDKLDVKVTVIKATLNNGKGVVDYTVTY